MQGVEILMMRTPMSVTDIDEAIAFWDKLDIKLLWRWPDDVGGKGVGAAAGKGAGNGATRAAGLGAESIQIILIHEPDAEKIVPQRICVQGTGVDACHAACNAAHPDHTGPIGDREYGLRDFSVIDRRGHMIVFQEVLAEI